MNVRRVAKILLPCLVLGGCAGWQRSCTSWQNRNLGSDWIVVQYDFMMSPNMCWKLTKVSVANEENSDGIHWLDNNTNAMHHIGGWYNYVQVVNGDFATAGSTLHVNAGQCKDGVYPTR